MSAYELQTQTLIAQHLGYLVTEVAGDLKGRLDRVGRMLNGLISFTTSKRKTRAGA